MKQFTDSPILVVVDKTNDGHQPGRFLRANTIDAYKDEENGEWKFLMFDENAKAPKMPKGSVGHRWQKAKQGQWNLELKDGLDESEINPLLSFVDQSDEVLQLDFEDFSNNNATAKRGVPIKYLDTNAGTVAVTTIFDLLMAHFGVNRDLGGDYPSSYDDAEQIFTPAWQEKFTGIDKASVIKFAQEFANTAEKTAAGMAESRITTVLRIPVRLKILTIRMPSNRPTPILKKEARKVVGRDFIFTLDRLYPNIIRTRGMAINPMKSNGSSINLGTLNFKRLNINPRIAA